MDKTSLPQIRTVSCNEFINMVKRITETTPISPFLSVNWMHAWSQMVPDAIYYCVYIRDEAIGGFALRQTKTVRYGIYKCQLFLHRAGQQVRDQVWIEENDVICLPEYRKQVWQALLASFKQSSSDELIVAMSYELADIDYTGFKLEQELTSPSYARTLEASYANIDNLLAAFSRNTRSQIKRAIKKLPRGVELANAKNSQHAFDMLDWAALHHQKRWHDSGFLNPTFVEFHQRVIRFGVVNDSVRLLQFSVGEQVAAVYYYFLQNKRVYFYLGAVNYDSFDDKHKIGLVAHCYAMSYFAGLGYKIYDFLAGEARYKASLSNIQTEQHMYVVSKPKLKLAVINALKSIKQIITRK
ncbi:protein involved in cellulose biosynthesis (CelD)-like protein [Catenovulum agarivorans DS-2]|uniref:Protein involved in cellulose biosynthesis (CelD)-like protein n=1 Tax=Catenovulum agarivorans DS-2 TaxID=1328313 RepID=W7R0K1_9ALTE|nr:GNAT family N-acetyltransferase [Catenovulum agarivorans]EWH11135.1 protein involved in cellulose biosynthesis (CelD)-like protein [Catenovulum agarivorans DS-2]